MKFLSFDIGIKNLAYCYAEYKDGKLEILEWDIINLLANEFEAQQRCSHISRNRPYKPCSKFAYFGMANGSEFYCKAHKKNYKHVKPVITKCGEEGKCSKEECNKKIRYTIDEENVCASHKVIIDSFFKKNLALKKIKVLKCKDFSVCDIADKMITILDERYPHLLCSDIVLLELQPALTNPMMKTISNYLSMYYRMNGKHYGKNGSTIKEVKYFRATNKLEFDKSNTETNKSSYKNRKKTGIYNVIDYLNSVGDELNKQKFLSHKKQDDLADAILQILVYIKASSSS